MSADSSIMKMFSEWLKEIDHTLDIDLDKLEEEASLVKLVRNNSFLEESTFPTEWRWSCESSVQSGDIEAGIIRLRFTFGPKKTEMDHVRDVVRMFGG